MTKSDFLQTLEFNSFERYPLQFSAIYLKCDGLHKYSKRYKCRFLRIDNFDATTFSPKDMVKELGNEYVEWSFSWLPADVIDKEYDKGDFIKRGLKHW